jgi:uncharacterized protein (TIGR02186 family)
MTVWRIFIFVALAALVRPARADELVSGLSTDLIQITSNFQGTDIVLFGAIEPTETTGPAKDQDIVLVIRGPDLPMTVRRRERILGIWVNREQVELNGMPGYYFLSSTRPLDDIAPLPTLQRFRLGTANLSATPEGSYQPDEVTAFKAALIRNRKREHLYWESPTGIEFLSRTLFRARIPVPAAAPPGQYRAEVYLFSGGTVVSAQSSPLFIDKTGFEREVYNFAFDESLMYGLIAVALSMGLGGTGYLAFRRR